MAELQKMNYRHLGVLDWMINNPHRNLGECAKELGYSQSWLSLVIGSDLFKAELQRRRSGLEVQQDFAITSRLQRIANKGLEAIEESLKDKETAKPLDATELALKALGYIGNKTNTPGGATVSVTQNIQNNTLQVAPDALAEAREIMQKLHATPSQVLQHDIPLPALEYQSDE